MNKKSFLSLALLSALYSQSTYSMEIFSDSEYPSSSSSASSSGHGNRTPNFLPMPRFSEQRRESTYSQEKEEKDFNYFDALLFCNADSILKVLKFLLVPLVEVDHEVIKEISASIMADIPTEGKEQEAKIKKFAEILANDFIKEHVEIGDCSAKAIAARFSNINGQKPANDMAMLKKYGLDVALRSKEMQKFAHKTLLVHLDSKALNLMQRILDETFTALDNKKVGLEKELKNATNDHAKKSLTKKIKGCIDSKVTLKDIEGYLWRARHSWMAHVALLSKSQQLALGASVVAGAACFYKYMTTKKDAVVDTEEEDPEYMYAE